MHPSMRHALNAFFDISRHVTSMVLPGTPVSMWGMRLPRQSMTTTSKFTFPRPRGETTSAKN